MEKANEFFSGLLTDGDALQKYLMDSAEQFDFENSTLAKMDCLIDHIRGIEQINPVCDETDDSLCAFLMYLIKDYLSHCGYFPK